MSRKRHSREEIVLGLLQVNVLAAQGRTIGAAARTIGVTRTTLHRCRNEISGLEFDRAERRKELEAENHQPRKAVANLTLDRVISTEAGGRHARPS